MAVLLLDCHSLLYRAFHALPPMNTASGTPTQALYGFALLLLKLLREEAPSQIAFAADLPVPTFRHALRGDYKAGRPKTPAALQSQLGALPELCAAFAVVPACLPGYEADDVLASLAHALSGAGVPQLVVSGDRDLLQLVGPHTTVLFAGQRGKDAVRYDEPRFHARFGFPPARLPLYSALLGELADNLPKVPGIGEATAKRLVAEHESADALLSACPALTGRRLGDTLLAHAEQLRTTERLARLERGPPLAQGELLGSVDAAALERLGALFERWEFKSLRARLSALTPR